MLPKMNKRLAVAAGVSAIAVLIANACWADCDPSGAGDATPDKPDLVALNDLKNRTETPPSLAPMQVPEVLEIDDVDDATHETEGVVLEGPIGRPPRSPRILWTGQPERTPAAKPRQPRRASGVGNV
jgi:hypothetical protein